MCVPVRVCVCGWVVGDVERVAHARQAVGVRAVQVGAELEVGARGVVDIVHHGSDGGGGCGGGGGFFG